MDKDFPKEILRSLSDDEKRMVLAGRVDSGGEGAASWTHVFASDDRIWQMTSTRPEPHLTRLGVRVFYAAISTNKDATDAE